jgi:hypothetical protein
LADLTVLCYLWGNRKYRDYGPEHVNVLTSMVRRHLPREHRFVCITDDASGFDANVETIPFTYAAWKLQGVLSPEGIQYPSCYARLWNFSEEAREILGERVLLLDIDVVIKGNINGLVDHDEDFVGWRPNTVWGNEQRFAGGAYLLRTGSRTKVWDDFIANPLEAQRRAHAAGYRGSDQAWISYCLGKTEKCWQSNLMAPPEEFHSYDWKQKAPYTTWQAKPKNLQWYHPPEHPVIQFCGHTKPWQLLDVPWIAEHWR